MLQTSYWLIKSKNMLLKWMCNNNVHSCIQRNESKKKPCSENINVRFQSLLNYSLLKFQYWAANQFLNMILKSTFSFYWKLTTQKYFSVSVMPLEVCSVISGTTVQLPTSVNVVFSSIEIQRLSAIFKVIAFWEIFHQCIFLLKYSPFRELNISKYFLGYNLKQWQL